MATRIFLAGPSGAIGKRLVKLLGQGGYRVTGMTRDAVKADLLRNLGARPVVADVYDVASLTTQLRAFAPAIVIHQLTALPPGLEPSRMEQAVVANARIRDEGTHNLVAAALAARRFPLCRAEPRLGVRRRTDTASPGRSAGPNGRGFPRHQHARRCVAGAAGAANIRHQQHGYCATAISTAPGQASTRHTISHRCMSMMLPVLCFSQCSAMHWAFSTWLSRTTRSPPRRQNESWAGVRAFASPADQPPPASLAPPPAVRPKPRCPMLARRRQRRSFPRRRPVPATGHREHPHVQSRPELSRRSRET